MMEDVGLDPTLLCTKNKFFAFADFVKLFEHAAQTLAEPNFGIKHALHHAPHFLNVGAIMFLAQFERTIGTWLNSTVKLMGVNSTAHEVKLIHNFDEGYFTTRLIKDPFVPLSRQINEEEAAVTYLVYRNLMRGQSIEPMKICFTHTKPADTSLHEEVFKCPLQFGSDFCEMVFPMEVLSQPIASNIKFLKPAVDTAVKMALVLGRREPKPSGLRVRLTISMLFGTGRCNFDSVAHTLNIHPKTLQRKLTQEGLTFTKILEDVRRSQAAQMLKDSNLSVEQIALFLDYSGSAAFTLAFKRWYGLPPGQFRSEAVDTSNHADSFRGGVKEYL